MTRFARAKGSKASNEKLPEPATSWGEMKQELLNKNKELDEKKNHEKAMQQRQANYQAFLQEKEENENRNVSWADFSETRNSIKEQNTSNTSMKPKVQFKDDVKKNTNSLESSFKNKNFNNVESKADDFDDSDEEFSTLKLQIDEVLDNQETNDSDSDAPPEETSVREKPKEIIVKKAKKAKQKLQILIKQKDKSEDKSNKMVRKGVKKWLQENAEIGEENRLKAKKDNLSDKDKKKIEKKQERYIKQLDKKKLKRQEYKSKNTETMDDDDNDDETNTDLRGPVAKKQGSEISSEIDAKKQEKKLERRKKQKEKKLKKKQEAGLINTLESKEEEVLTEKDLANIQKKKERRARQAEKRKKFREAKALAAQTAESNKQLNSEQATYGNDGCDSKNNVSSDINKQRVFQNKVNGGKGNTDLIERKPFQKQLDNQKGKRKREDSKDLQRKKFKPDIMFINGMTIEIDYIDGFPVKKEDADRLKKLRKEMISKGLPRSEINVSLKLERRRAEKALAREKKNVCFNCRKSGHNLSECPELDKDQMAQTSGTGICFKCGSTEHTHFECKVVKGLDYKFATCFICQEQGHISKQCPDNQRGLYPKGGACKECGDVTHLKKDCPKYQAQQAQLQDSLSIETMDNRNPDDLGSKKEFKNTLGPMKKLNKVRF